MKLYVKELGQKLLDIFDDIPKHRKVLWTLEDFPPPEELKNFANQLVPGDKFLVVHFDRIEIEVVEDMMVYQPYFFNLFLYTKMTENMAIFDYKDQTANDTVEKLDNWILENEDENLDDYAKLADGKISYIDYAPAGDVLKAIGLTVIAIQAIFLVVQTRRRK
jgi:hypothetical protein